MKFLLRLSTSVAVALLLVSDVAMSEPRAVCSDGGTDTPSPTITPTPTTPAPTTPAPTTPAPTTPTPTTPAPTTPVPTTPAPTTPAPTLAPVNCKLFGEDKDPGVYDGVCVVDPTDNLWYEHKTLSVETPASNGGEPCKTVVVKRQCKPVNCEYTDTVGACGVDKPTGKVVKPVTRVATVEPKYGGKACPPTALTPCEVEYFCGPLSASEQGYCKQKLPEIENIQVGFRNNGVIYRAVDGLDLWTCETACYVLPACTALDFVSNGVGMATCTWYSQRGTPVPSNLNVLTATIKGKTL